MDRMDRAELAASKAFLGTEFLTWLWFRSVRDAGATMLPGKAGLTLHVDQRIHLSTAMGAATEADLSGGTPATSAEAKAALREGKTLHAAAFYLATAEREWLFRLRGKTLDLGAVRLPPMLTRATDDRFYERMALLGELDDVVDGLFRTFVRLRLSPVWESERRAIQAWVAAP